MEMLKWYLSKLGVQYILVVVLAQSLISHCQD